MTSTSANVVAADKGVRLLHEEYPLPGTRKEIMSVIESTLDKGGVQKLILEIGKPIRISRYVKAEDSSDILEVRDEDLLYAARNAEMQELSQSEHQSSYEHLFKAFFYLSQRRLRPRAFITNSVETVRKWLSLDELFNLQDLYGVELIADISMPDDVILLVALKPEEQDSNAISFSLRLGINMPKKRVKT